VSWRLAWIAVPLVSALMALVVLARHDLAPELRLAVTGVRTAALQFGYFVGAAIGGLALAMEGFTALGLTLAALFVGATISHALPQSSAGPARVLP